MLASNPGATAVKTGRDVREAEGAERGPGSHLSMSQEWHWANFARAVASLASLGENRRDVVVVVNIARSELRQHADNSERDYSN